MKTVLRLRILLAFAAAQILGIAMSLFSLTAAIISISSALTILTAAFFYVPFYCDSILYTVDENSVSVSRGIVLKRNTTALKEQLLYTTSLSAPLLRAYGLRNVYYYGCGIKLKLCSLEKEDAERLIIK